MSTEGRLEVNNNAVTVRGTGRVVVFGPRDFRLVPASQASLEFYVDVRDADS